MSVNILLSNCSLPTLAIIVKLWKIEIIYRECPEQCSWSLEEVSLSLYSPIFSGWLFFQNKKEVQAKAIFCLYWISSSLTEVVEQSIFCCVAFWHTSSVSWLNKKPAWDLAHKKQILFWNPPSSKHSSTYLRSTTVNWSAMKLEVWYTFELRYLKNKTKPPSHLCITFTLIQKHFTVNRICKSSNLGVCYFSGWFSDSHRTTVPGIWELCQDMI